MSGSLFVGVPVLCDGSLPASALHDVGRNGFGVYVHVPFCASRCGYCDFNTYTATELGGGASQVVFALSVGVVLVLVVLVFGGRPGALTVFFGGGPPTRLPAADLVGLLRRVDATVGLDPDAEVTTEANPE